MIENNIRNKKVMIRGSIEKYHPTYANLSDLGGPLGASSLQDSCGSAFFLRPVFQNLWGRGPHGSMLASPRAPLVRCSSLKKNEKQTCSKIQRFQINKWHQPHLQNNKQGLKTTLPIINLRKSFVTFVV